MEQVPDYIYAEAWQILASCFGESMQQDELDLMDAVLARVVADEKDREEAKSTATRQLH